jgi:hypothetical protein
MKDCLERAMFAASESYSHTVYDLGDYGCEERADEERPAAYPISNQNWKAWINFSSGELP